MRLSRLILLPTLLFAASGCTEDPLPNLGTIPEMSLVDQNRQSFDRSDLMGRISIVDFVFTRCPAICPLLSEKMSQLQDRFEGAGPDVQLLSISVDPEHDTPDVLRAYAERYGADPARWRFLTGDADEVNSVVVRGFRQAMGEPVETEAGVDVMHSSHFVLVDREGEIRGFFANDSEGTEDLLGAVERLRSHR
jgi:protein SCO1/2